MMSSITYIDCNLPISCLKHRMPGIPFHIVCAFIEVPDSRYMILQRLQSETHSCTYIMLTKFMMRYLPVLSNYVAMISNDHSSIPDCLPMVHIPFKDRTYYNHIVPPSKLLKKFCRFSIYWLCKLTPFLLASAESKWHHPCLLKHG